MGVPLHEILETFLVLENSAEAAQTDPFESIIAIFDQIEQDLNAFHIQEVQLGSLVPIDCVLKTV